MKAFQVTGQHFEPEIGMATGKPFRLKVKARTPKEALAKVNKCRTNIAHSVKAYPSMQAYRDRVTSMDEGDE